MTDKKESGLAAIARSTQAGSSKAPRNHVLEGRAEEKPTLELQGQRQNTSLTLDVGVVNYLADMTNLVNKRLRGTGRTLVAQGRIMEAALRAFHELPLEEQLAL